MLIVCAISALVAYAVTGVVTDFMILIVPLVYVHSLLMDAGSKRATSFVFLLGFMCVLCLSRYPNREARPT